MALSSNLYALKLQKLKKLLAETVAPKVAEWPSYGNFRKVTQNPLFVKKCKVGTEGNVSKITQKKRHRLKGPKALWRKWHYRLLSMHLNCKDWRRFSQTAAPKVPECPSYGTFGKATQKPHFLKKCKGGAKGNFSKLAQKVALPWKAQNYSGANGIIL